MRPEISLHSHYFIFAQGIAMDQLNELTTTSLVSAKEETLPAIAAHQSYWQIATSNNTRRAYQSDVRHFISSGGLLPATTESLMHYLNSQAGQTNPRTLKRRLVAIKQWHVTQTFPDSALLCIFRKS